MIDMVFNNCLIHIDNLVFNFSIIHNYICFIIYKVLLNLENHKNIKRYYKNGEKIQYCANLYTYIKILFLSKIHQKDVFIWY